MTTELSKQIFLKAIEEHVENMAPRQKRNLKRRKSKSKLNKIIRK